MRHLFCFVHRFLPGFLLLAILFGSHTGLAQHAEPVYPLTHNVRPATYYHEQARLWQDSLRVDSATPIHWLYYYMAARNANLLDRKSPAYDLAAIAQQVADQHPNSFERYYISFASSRELSQEERWDLMLRAHRIAPHRTEVWAALILYYELKPQAGQKKKYLEQWLAAGLCSSDLLDWNYNALASVATDGILLTQGDNDTYPAWALQEVHDIRPDVSLLNLPLLLNYPDYRNRLFQELGVADDLDLPPTLPYFEKASRLVQHLQEQVGDRLYLGIGLDDRLRATWGQSLYLTGLAFRYAEGAMENLPVLKTNWEQSFRKDGLYHPLTYGPARQTTDQMNLNYLPGLLTLERAYRREQSPEKADNLLQLSRDIARRAEREDLLSQIAPALSPPADFVSRLSLKSIENQMQAIGENVYAAATETTNDTYTRFLLDLLSLRDQEHFNRFQPAAVDWPAYLPEGLAALSGEVLYTPYHPDDEEAPIVNISTEAATAFCNWLTELYHRWDKRKYQQVRFRLPTETEWVRAARGGHQFSPFPWGGMYVQNSRGCYLLNTNPFLPGPDVEEKKEMMTGCLEAPNQDGAFFPIQVDAYYPNDFGLYNMSGNAAEMIQDASFTKGGSWNEAIYYAQIGVRHEQNIPSPMVGFRIFMEVLEY